MNQIEDIKRYILRMNLMGIYPFIAQKKDITNRTFEFIEVPEDISYNNIVGDINIKYKVNKGDYLNITDRRNILPIKKKEFDLYYFKPNITRVNIDIDW